MTPFMSGIFGMQQPQAQPAAGAFPNNVNWAAVANYGRGAPAAGATSPFGINQQQMQQALAAAQQRNAMAQPGAAGGAVGTPNMTLGQLIGGIGGAGSPWGQQPAAAGIPQPGNFGSPTMNLGGLLSGIFGARGGPMGAAGQQPNLTAPPFAGRFNMMGR